MLAAGILGCTQNHEEQEPEEPEVPIYERDTTGRYFIHDYSKVKELHAQPLHVIQESVQGKWKLQYSFGWDGKRPDTAGSYMQITAGSIIIDVTDKGQAYNMGPLFDYGTRPLIWEKTDIYNLFVGFGEDEDSVYVMSKIDDIIFNTGLNYIPTQVTGDSLVIIELISHPNYYFFTKYY